MFLFVGLGNPGSKYAGHRHNVGYMAVDEIADAQSFGPERQRFQGLTREGFLDTSGGREKVLLLKPSTYMNESGRSVGEAVRFYQIPLEKIFVFYDELDLEPGRLRIKVGGGAAGHNGIRSIAAHIGKEFRRVRIGIGHPGDRNRVSGYVLRDFAKSDKEWLTPLLDEIGRSAPLLASGEDNSFMNKVALAVNPPPIKPNPNKETE